MSYLFNVVLLGDTNTGKTAILKQYTKNLFETTTSTIGVDFGTKNIIVNNKNVFLEIWDTAGQEIYHSISKNYYNKADGVIIVFDITSKKSFYGAIQWIKELKNVNETSIIILVGNKNDLGECLFNKEITEFIHENDILYVNVTAMNYSQIEKIFYVLSSQLLNSNDLEKFKFENKNEYIDLKNLKRNNSKKKCCSK